MAILVTGVAGFVALNVVEHLLAAGRDVVGLDRIPLPDRAVRDFATLPGQLTMLDGTILSEADLARAMTAMPLEAVIHCAVITAGSRRETTDPESIVAVNVQGAVTTLMAAVRRGIKRFVYPSSGAIYGLSAATVDVMDEDTLRPAPVNLYGLTKFAAESILPRIAETQGVSLTAVRLGVVYGPWEYATGVRDTLSPMLQTLECATAGTPAILGPPWRGDYTCSRDIAAGLVAIADAPMLPRKTYNLATGRGTTAEAWCEALAARLPGFRWRRATQDEPFNVDSHTGFDRGAMSI
ncbi:MAG TPA: NAD-dependent epimerase/dehydratase family protein, partial [Rhodopila sp.]|nr:NAD-dependent epimerase/dehydratase family protein [Rhodopila sp.]